MKITYDKIFSILNSNFKLVNGQRKNYFLDNSNRIVATIDENLITMFYDFPELSREIWNHEGKVAIAFARNFNINGQLCDILLIDGLCGTFNDFIMNKDFFINITTNSEMRCLLGNHENSLQKQFEELSYEEKIAILKKVKGADFTGAKIDGIKLFSDGAEYKLGNCGYLSSTNGIASFNICSEIKVDNMVVNKKQNGIDINIIDVKKTKKKANYSELYNLYRQENDWYYNLGYKTAGSLETRAFTERRRYATVDKDAIHITKQVIKDAFDPIYEKSNQSLNAKRLQMLYILNLFLENKKESENYVSSHYNFNIRNCDFRKLKVKK